MEDVLHICMALTIPLLILATPALCWCRRATAEANLRRSIAIDLTLLTISVIVLMQVLSSPNHLTVVREMSRDYDEQTEGIEDVTELREAAQLVFSMAMAKQKGRDLSRLLPFYPLLFVIGASGVLVVSNLILLRSQNSTSRGSQPADGPDRE